LTLADCIDLFHFAVFDAQSLSLSTFDELNNRLISFWQCVYNRNLRSFKNLFKFEYEFKRIESAIPVQFDWKAKGQFENFEPAISHTRHSQMTQITNDA